jgi:predicted nucleic acid-binding Zn ribbon protein
MGRKPRVLEEILQAWLKSSGVERAVAAGRLIEEWESIVGPRISAASRPIDVRGKTLVIEVEDPVWRNELSLLQGTILDEISRRPALPEVRAIRFVGRRGGGRGA